MTTLHVLALGAIGGFLAVLFLGLCFVLYRLCVRTASHRAGSKRALKFVGFQLAGAILVNAVLLVTGGLVHFGADPALVTLASTAVGGIASGVHKSRTWVTATAQLGSDPAATLSQQ
jgi:hypothetical protein